MNIFSKIIAAIMGLCFLVVITFFIISSIAGNKKSQNEKWGYINTNGNAIIECTYDQAYSFSEGLGCVRITEKGYGYIKKDGTIFISPELDKAYSFSEGLGCIRQEKKWLYITSDKKIVLESEKFTAARPFYNSLAPVALEWYLAKTHISGSMNRQYPTTYGFINKQGNFVIKAEKKYYQAGSFNEGIAFMKDAEKNQTYHAIDMHGNILFSLSSQQEPRCKEGYIIFGDVQSGLHGFYDMQGNIVIEAKYTYAHDFSEGFALVGNKRFGFINKKGEVIIGTYEDAKSFSQGMAAVKIKGKWGYIDTKGNIIIEPKYYDAQIFSEGLAAVRLTKKYDSWGYINKSGEIIINGTYREARPFSEGMAAVKKKI